MKKFEQDMHNIWIKIKVLIMVILFVTPIILYSFSKWWLFLYLFCTPAIIYIMETTKEIKDFLSEKVRNKKCLKNCFG